MQLLRRHRIVSWHPSFSSQIACREDERPVTTTKQRMEFARRENPWTKAAGRLIAIWRTIYFGHDDDAFDTRAHARISSADVAFRVRLHQIFTFERITFDAEKTVLWDKRVRLAPTILIDLVEENQKNEWKIIRCVLWSGVFRNQFKNCWISFFRAVDQTL